MVKTSCYHCINYESFFSETLDHNDAIMVTEHVCHGRTYKNRKQEDSHLDKLQWEEYRSKSKKCCTRRYEDGCEPMRSADDL